MNKKADRCKVDIEYPCLWLYKVIGRNPDQLREAILETVSDEAGNISYSNSSNSGKYHCLNLEVKVQSENERNGIYMALKRHPHVKIVL